VWIPAQAFCCAGPIRQTPKGRKQMKSSTKDQLKSKFHEVKGKVKEKAGQITNNPDLEAEGKSENIDGKIQKKIGQIKAVFEK
jgi:uncharacterized protein YjbJ (UPF0337 family)